MFRGVHDRMDRSEASVQQEWSREVGKRFKTALGAVACVSLLMAIAGPVLAVTTEGDQRVLVLVIWISLFVLSLAFVTGSTLLSYERRVLRMISSVRREVASKNNSDVIAEIRDVRLKQSRHEYKQELLLDRIDSASTTLMGDVDSLSAEAVVPALDRIPWHGGGDRGPKILFLTSNGSGMGHLSRCLAVALEAEKVGYRTAILTLSTAYQVVRDSGYPVMYHPSATVSPWSLPVWNRSFARFLHRRLTEDRPDIVIFDGTAVYRGVTQVCRRLEIPLIWMRRGMWKSDVTRVQYDRPFEVADFVVVPGEVTGALTPDQNDVQYVGPVSQADQFTIHDPLEAKRSLGLDPQGNYALVQVGSAQMSGGPAVGAIVDAIKESAAGVVPVVMVSPVSEVEPEVPGAIVVHGRYPLAPYLRAFDFAVTSAGYNSVHENLATGLPAAYLPNTAAVTDDQTARAELVAESGLGFVVHNELELREAVQTLSEPREVALIRDSLAAEVPADGARTIVDSLHAILESTQIDVLHPRG